MDNSENKNILKESFEKWKYIKNISKLNDNLEEGMSISSMEDSSIEDTNDYNSNNSIEEYELQFKEKELEENSNEIINETRLKKLSIHAIEKHIDKYYNDENHSMSSALDILASYLKGQKIIYIEAMELTEWRLNMLMFPALLLSSAASVAAETFGCGKNHRLYLCMMNVGVSLLLAIINFCKLDAISQAHKISASQYDTLQSSVEFLSGSILLSLKSEYKGTTSILKTVEEKLLSVEEKIMEVKQTNQNVIPRTVRRLFPVIFNTNIFSIIKKIDDQKKKVITQLKNVKNEIRFINTLQKDNHLKGKVMTKQYRMKLFMLFNEKKDLLKQILLLKSAYSIIDQMFNQEIKNAEKIKSNIIKYLLCKPDFVSKHNYMKNKYYINNKFIDPEKINDFLENLIDPFKCNDNIKKEISTLDTLWFNINEQDWIDKEYNNDIEQGINKKDEDEEKIDIDIKF